MIFTKFRWICTIIGLIFSVVDIGSDLLLSVQYFREGHSIWFALTLLFIFIGSLCAQIFSYSWFKDDHNGEVETRPSTTCLVLLHLLQMGFFTRYYELLKRSFKCIWCRHSAPIDQRELFGLAADLSMLRLMETFLESVPQLLLQTYIILQHQHTSKLQYLSMTVSFLNVAWSTVDYWRCLRRSLPNTDEIPRGLPTAVYLFYKILTISARILSLTLLIMLNTLNILALVFIWLVATVWAHVVNTDFCTSLFLEELYRSIIGVVLVFTFFNVKGKKTKTEMSVYYVFSMLQNVSAPGLLFLFVPRTAEADFFLPVTFFILMANTMGLGFLILYYSVLHTQNHRVADAMDGPEITNADNSSTESRLDRFLSL